MKASSPTLVPNPREERKLFEEPGVFRLVMLVLFLEFPPSAFGFLQLFVKASRLSCIFLTGFDNIQVRLHESLSDWKGPSPSLGIIQSSLQIRHIPRLLSNLGGQTIIRNNLLLNKSLFLQTLYELLVSFSQNLLKVLDLRFKVLQLRSFILWAPHLGPHLHHLLRETSKELGHKEE
jgi:hypothetical protein